MLRKILSLNFHGQAFFHVLLCPIYMLIQKHLRPFFSSLCYSFLPIAGALLLSSCATGDLATIEKEKADTIYNQGLANFEANRLSEAAKKFAAVERQFPYSDWARKALIMGIYSSYLKHDYPEVIGRARRYIERYPNDKETPYAYYMVGLAYFEQIPDVSRDQSFAKNTIIAMKALISHYPHTDFAQDGLIKIRYAREHLAGNEMQVARFYQNRKAYLAALSRYYNVIKNYSDTYQIEEALYRCVEINLTLGLKDQAKRFGAILGHNFPKSIWYGYTYKLLTKYLAH